MRALGLFVDRDPGVQTRQRGTGAGMGSVSTEQRGRVAGSRQWV